MVRIPIGSVYTVHRKVSMTEEKDSEDLTMPDFPNFPFHAWADVWERLNYWERHGAELADEGFDPPTPHCIEQARAVLAQWMTLACSPPSIVADPNGGIILQWHTRELYIQNEE
ncbi:MAG: hypothetical protein QXT45_04850 [Candidatus Bilamarchaeaceae archaeon]